MGRGPAPRQPIEKGVPGLPANGHTAWGQQVGRRGSTCGLMATSPHSTSAPQGPMGKRGVSPSANSRWGAPRCPRSLANRDLPRPPRPPSPAQQRAGRGGHPRGAARDARCTGRAGPPPPGRARPASGRTCTMSSRRSTPPAPRLAPPAPAGGERGGASSAAARRGGGARPARTRHHASRDATATSRRPQHGAAARGPRALGVGPGA